MKEFKNQINHILELVEQDDMNIQNIAKNIVGRMAKGGKFYVFGTGHSHMIGEEFYARAGGLANVYMIAPLELTLSEHPFKSTLIERIPEYADVVIQTNKIGPNDAIMICSNSGRNGCLVEMALKCKEMGCYTIALTSVDHSMECSSRHPSHFRLCEVCEDVIDTHGSYGDATIQLPKVKGTMGSTSTIIGAYIAQTLGMYIALAMVDKGMEPPVFLSSNVDGGDEWNDEIMQKYYGV